MHEATLWCNVFCRSFSFCLKSEYWLRLGALLCTYLPSFRGVSEGQEINKDKSMNHNQEYKFDTQFSDFCDISDWIGGRVTRQPEILKFLINPTEHGLHVS